MAIGICPGLLAAGKCDGSRQTFRGGEGFESGEPMFIVVRTIVGLTTICRCFELACEGGRPFLPCEVSLFGEFHGQRECLGLPRLGKQRSISVGRRLY